jgi:hypothetical protein
MTILSCWWRGASGIACANDANVKAKPSAINLVIASLQFTPHKEQLAKHGIWFGEFEADQESVAIVASMPRSVSALSGKADMVPCRAPISRRCRIWVRNGHPQDSDHCPLILVAPHFRGIFERIDSRYLSIVSFFVDARAETKAINYIRAEGLSIRGVPRCATTAFKASNRGLPKLATS